MIFRLETNVSEFLRGVGWTVPKASILQARGTVAGQADGTATLADPDGYTIVVADDAASL